MRWMKKLLTAIYLYTGVFFTVCLVYWMATGLEPSSLVMGVSAAVGVESVAAGVIRVFENRESYRHEKEMQYGQGQQNWLGTETDEP